MKILHITTHLNKGGITSYLFSLAIELKKRGHNLIISSSGGEVKESFLKNGVEHLDIPICTKSDISPKLLFSYFILSRFLLKNRVDIIHAHTRVTQILAFFLSQRFRIPLVTTCHGFFRPRWHRKIFPCWGDRVIAISSQVKEHLMKDFKAKEEDIRLIHNGVDLDKFKDYTREEINDLRREIGLTKDSFIVGSAGRFSTVKGLEYFIKAAPAVLKNNENVVFLLIGYGKEKSRLRQIAKDLKVENKIVFFKPIRETYEYLGVMDVFVMPSTQEGLGLSLLEAQAQKIPVVASRVGGIPDIIEDGTTGILVEPKDESALSSAILKLMRDRDFYSKLRDNAYDKITKEFTLGQMVVKTEKLYEGLLCHLE